MAEGLEPINAIDAANASALYVNTTTQIYTTLNEITQRRLEEYGIDVSTVKSEKDAEKILQEKETEKTEKTNSQKNAETYYDKQVISDAINLAEDIGIYVGFDTDVRTIMENIKYRLTMLNNTVGDNKHLKEVIDEYSNRYDYIYAQYMNKKDFLENQIVTSLDAMSVSSATLSTKS